MRTTSRRKVCHSVEEYQRHYFPNTPEASLFDEDDPEKIGIALARRVLKKIEGRLARK